MIQESCLVNFVWKSGGTIVALASGLGVNSWMTSVCNEYVRDPAHFGFLVFSCALSFVH